MNGNEDAMEATEAEPEAAAAGGNSNVTEMEIMENFVRSLVEDWRYQGRMTDGQTDAARILS